MRHIIPISGKDSCATALVQLRRQPDLPYELFFNDVGAELPETYAWLDRVEHQLARPLVRVGRSLEELIRSKGLLPSPHIRFCTQLGKIKPLEDYIGKDSATIYFGLRADEDRVGYVPVRGNILPVYPLRDLGLGLGEVYGVLHHFDLKPPTFFWKELYNEVCWQLDVDSQADYFISHTDAKATLAPVPFWVFDQLFAWRSRSNCFCCFFQRLYEWVGLLDHHPELFRKAEALEETYGNDHQEKPFTWIAGCPLGRLRKHRELVIRKRVRAVVKALRQRQAAADPADLLSVTSCGFFCGK